MDYGVTIPNHSVFIQGSTYILQLAWAREHNSDGRYNYQAHGHYTDMGVVWNFSKEEDAVLFALKFK